MPDDLAHDAYFNIDRIDGDPVAVLVGTALSARAIYLAEVSEAPVSLDPAALTALDAALADLFGCLVGLAPGTVPPTTAWDRTGARTAVMPRWVRGHQVFAALTQGLILAFQAIGRAVRTGDGEALRRWVDLSVSLLRGSGGSFVLTGDFPVADYLRDVRPSMMPPAVPTCLSGLMSIDHRVMVQTIRGLKPAMTWLHERDPARHALLRAELAAVYDLHAHVCERFVGGRPSLLTAGSTEKSGPELIQQFKTLRLKPFDTPGHATRIMTPTPDGPSCPRGAKQGAEANQH